MYVPKQHVRSIKLSDKVLSIYNRLQFPYDDEHLAMGFANSVLYYSYSGNMLSYVGGFHFLVNMPLTDDESKVYTALINAYSFVINGNELFIYFKKIEDKDVLSTCKVIKNKNLLILKKR